MDSPPPIDAPAANPSSMIVLAEPPPVDPLNDPPPPYPSPGRTRRARGTRSHRRPSNVQRIQTATLIPSTDHTSADNEAYSSSPHPLTPTPDPLLRPDPETPIDASETTPLLTSSSPPRTQQSRRGQRPRSLSHASTASVAPSLAQTIWTMFSEYDSEREEEDSDGDGDGDRHRSARVYRNGEHTREDSEYARLNCVSTATGDVDNSSPSSSTRSSRSWYSKISIKPCKRYFRPLTRKAYYLAFFHLLLVNFPFALGTWVYLFVFTVTGTTLLIALPLGAILCFFDLLGARAFSRAELHLQTTFHSPLPLPAPYPPRPIFNRHRGPTASELESGRAVIGDRLPETSFYKNTYAMFTDPTTYQAIFYFLVIKPAITLSILLVLLVIGVPAFVLVIPAPAVLRATRRIGKWQAGVAVEGLYYAVR